MQVALKLDKEETLDLIEAMDRLMAFEKANVNNSKIARLKELRNKLHDARRACQ